MAAPLRQQVVQFIRHSIIVGEFRPGERLIERVLCERHQVSRTVIREVLRQLEAEGLVTVSSRGPMVATLTPEDVADLYETREILEATAARLFAQRASLEQRDELEERFGQLPAAYQGDDILAMLSVTDDFYDALLAGAGNSVVRQLLDTVKARINLLRGISMRAQGRAAQSLRELEALKNAAIAGDADAAMEAGAAHVRSAASVAKQRLGQMATTVADGTTVTEPTTSNLDRLKGRVP